MMMPLLVGGGGNVGLESKEKNKDRRIEDSDGLSG